VATVILRDGFDVGPGGVIVVEFGSGRHIDYVVQLRVGRYEAKRLY
jgi:hypothetical protein